MDKVLESLLQTDFDITATQLILAAFVVALGVLANRNLNRLSESFFGKDVRWIAWLRMWIPLARIVVWTATLWLVVTVVSPPPQLLFALLTSLGVAIGLAGQELIKNVFGALVVWSDRVYAEGDRVTIGEVEGIVKSIGLRSTKVWAFDDTMITVPNSLILSEPIYNANSGEPSEQVVIDLYLPLHADTEKAAELARAAAIASSYLDTSRPVVVRVADEYQDSPVSRIRVKAYVRGVRYENAFASEVAAAAKKMFRANNLYLP